MSRRRRQRCTHEFEFASEAEAQEFRTQIAAAFQRDRERRAATVRAPAREPGQLVDRAPRPFENFPTITRMIGGGLQGILAILGATVSGKTTLVAQLAADLARDDFPGVFCDLGFCAVLHDDEPDGQPETVARLLGLVRGAEHASRNLSYHVNYDEGLEKLRRSKTGFIVLDNMAP